MDGVRKFAAALVFGAATAVATASDASTVASVSWGAQSASVGTVTSSGSGAEFYGYSNYMANVPFSLSLGTVYAFIHEQTGTGALSLGMITTGTNMDPRGCRDLADRDRCRSYLSGWLKHAPASAEVTVMDGIRNVYGDEDDPSDTWAAGANGNYYISTFTGDTSGFVLDGLSIGDSLMFGFRKLTNFDNLVFVSGSEGAFEMTEFTIGNDLPKLWIDLESNAPQLPVSKTTVGPSPVPLPAGLVLLLSAFGLAGFGLRRRS